MTDYGLKCVDCSDSWIGEGCTEDDADKLLSDIQQLALLHNLQILLNTEITINMYFLSNQNEVGDLLDFCSKHSNHTVYVCDEYNVK